YQSGMNKQNVGIYRSSRTFSFDTSSRTLAYPTHPLYQTLSYQATGFDKNPAGQTALVGFTTHVGSNVEDALVINMASVERGFGAMFVRRTFNAETTTQHIDKTSGATSSVFTYTKKPDKPTGNVSHILDNGLPIIGS